MSRLWIGNCKYLICFQPIRGGFSGVLFPLSCYTKQPKKLQTNCLNSQTMGEFLPSGFTDRGQYFMNCHKSPRDQSSQAAPVFISVFFWNAELVYKIQWDLHKNSTSIWSVRIFSEVLQIINHVSGKRKLDFSVLSVAKAFQLAFPMDGIFFFLWMKLSSFMTAGGSQYTPALFLPGSLFLGWLTIVGSDVLHFRFLDSNFLF